MTITICGSIKFIDEMLSVRKELEAAGHEVKMPPTEIIDEGESDYFSQGLLFVEENDNGC